MPASEEHQRQTRRRRERVLAMRAAGMTSPQIADELRGQPGTPAAYGADQVRVDLRRILRERASEVLALADGALALELERLDGYARQAEALMRAATKAGSRADALRALDRLLAISGRRDELLGISRLTAAAQDDAGDGPPAEEVVVADGLDEVGRKRAARRRAYAE